MSDFEKLINASDLIEWIMETYPDWCVGAVRSIVDHVKSMRSTQPEREKGKWIDEPVYKQTMDGKTLDGYTYCSECREMHEYGYRSNYCPNCGAEMRKGEEE